MCCIEIENEYFVHFCCFILKMNSDIGNSVTSEKRKKNRNLRNKTLVKHETGIDPCSDDMP